MCNRLNIRLLLVISCFQWFKDTKMKANHNAVLLSPSSTASQSASHNNFQRTVGSETDIYQSNKISYALGIYKRYNDPNYEVLISARPKIKLLKIIDVI